MAPPQTLDQEAFLRVVCGDGPYILTLICADRKDTPQVHVLRNLARAAGRKQSVGWNLYFQPQVVNVPKSGKFPKGKRVSQENVAGSWWLWSDLDASKAQILEDELDRIQDLLDNWPDHVPEPTLRWWTGGGCQLMWRLTEPLKDLTRLEEANRWLATHICGDTNCCEPSRLLRLPNSLNYPSETKKKQPTRDNGTRGVRQAGLADYWEHKVYEIGLFGRTEKLNTKQATKKIDVDPGDIPTITEVEELPDEIPERTRQLILKGLEADPDKHYKNDRSRMQFGVIQQLLNSNIADEVICGILLSKHFKISDHTYEQEGRDPTEYAVRQVAEAHRKRDLKIEAEKKEVNAVLGEMNSRHAVIGNYGGKCRVIEELKDPLTGMWSLSAQTFEAFQDRYRHQKIVVGHDDDNKPKYAKKGSWWLDHPKHRQYDRVVFAPEKTVPDAYNLWTGFGVKPKQGDCSKFKEHCEQIICSGNKEYFEYLWGWLATMVQKPWEQGHVAVVLRGKKGSGKGSVANYVGKIFGRHYLTISNSKHLVGSFNAHLRSVVFLFADEADYKRYAGTLQALITEPLLTIEPKGVDVTLQKNCLHLLMASEEGWIVPAGAYERRYFVSDVSDEKMQNLEYFRALDRERDSGGAEALLWELQNYDLGNFNVRNVPQTKGLMDQKIRNLKHKPLYEVWFGMITESGFPWGEAFSADELSGVVKLKTNKYVSTTKAGRFLGPYGLNLEKTQEEGRNRYKVPTRREAIEKWNAFQPSYELEVPEEEEES